MKNEEFINFVLPKSLFKFCSFFVFNLFLGYLLSL